MAAAGRVLVGAAKSGRRRMLRAPLEVTDRAFERLGELLRGKEVFGVRVGVERRGCNGLSYTMDYVEEPSKVEEVVSGSAAGLDVNVVIDSKALLHVVGTTMDYKEDAISSEFVFSNPNAKGVCGCGESFNTG